ncbi:MAG: NTP transferase domain-containing protein [Paludibacteraceae bacterium]|nr:NTP transferase domain-containing protein [Paludibacteraceae bacterium]
MKAMIFAAGLGTRLRPLTDNMPKALVPLNGKSLLEYQIVKLREAGIRDIMVNVHHFPDMIIEYLREHDGFGCNISISDERDMLLDTGGGLLKAWDGKEAVLALNVDILSNIDIQSVVNACRRDDDGLLVVSNRKTQRYLCFDDNGYLCGWTNVSTGEIKGKDGKHLAFSGMSVLNEHTAAELQLYAKEKGSKFSLIDFYLHICGREKLKAYEPEDYKMMDVGKIDLLEEAEAFAKSL